MSDLAGKVGWVSMLVVLCAGLAVALVLGTATEDAEAAKKRACPTGMQKFVHVCIETTDRGVGTFTEASAECAAASRRLPTAAELEAFRQRPGVTIGQSDTEGFEWTGNILGSNVALLLKDDGGSVASGYSSIDAFRCVK